MPIYPFKCSVCNTVDEVLLNMGADIKSLPCSHCRGISIKQMTCPAVIKVEGSWDSPRGRWCRDWTPNAPSFSTGSHHGEKY